MKNDLFEKVLNNKIWKEAWMPTPIQKEQTMNEKDEWTAAKSAELQFKPPEERPENYQVRAQIMGRDVEFVSKKLYIEALDRAHHAEEQLEALKFAWQSFQKYLGAAQSPEKSVPSVGQSPSLDK